MIDVTYEALGGVFFIGTAFGASIVLIVLWMKGYL